MPAPLRARALKPEPGRPLDERARPSGFLIRPFARHKPVARFQTKVTRPPCQLTTCAAYASAQPCLSLGVLWTQGRFDRRCVAGPFAQASGSWARISGPSSRGLFFKGLAGHFKKSCAQTVTRPVGAFTESGVTQARIAGLQQTLAGHRAPDRDPCSASPRGTRA